MNRYAHAVYCDDIRMELGNKLSLMGIYDADLFVPEVPITIPKLCIFLSVVTPASNPFQSLTVRVLKDEEVLLEAKIPEESLSQSLKDQPAEIASIPAGDKLVGIKMSFVLAPFTVDRPFFLRVRALTETEELRSSALSIKVANPEQTPAKAA